MIAIPIIIFSVLGIWYTYMWSDSVAKIDFDDFNTRFREIKRMMIFFIFALFLIVALIEINSLEKELEDQSKDCPEYEQIDNIYILKEKQ